MDWELDEAIAYYRTQGAPNDQNALTNLLREIQQHSGGAIPPSAVAELARAYGIKESLPLAVIRRLPSLRLAESHCLELCAGPNCSKRAALAAFVEKTWGAQPQGFTVRYVPCMRMCGKGPNIRYDGTLYHQADEALLRRLLPGAKK